VDQRSDARKEQKGRDEALALAKSVSQIVIARGKKIIRFDMRHSPPGDETLLAHLLGPTGNLRAPTLRKGNTLLVGFGDEAYRELFCR
jgi:hypothetical protein